MQQLKVRTSQAGGRGSSEPVSAQLWRTFHINSAVQSSPASPAGRCREWRWRSARTYCLGARHHTCAAAGRGAGAGHTRQDNGGAGRGGTTGLTTYRDDSGGGDTSIGFSWLSLLARAILCLLAWLASVAGITWVREQHLQQHAARIAGADTWKISIIIPVLNEEKCIGRTITWLRDNLHEAGGRRAQLEIIVVDAGSQDRTVSAARSAGASRVVAGPRGRGSQMNVGAQHATGDVLVFLHADTQPPSNLVPLLRRHLSDPRTVLLGFHPHIQDDKGRDLAYFTWHNANKTWIYPLLIRPLSYFHGLRLMFGDQVLCCRAADFREVGGFTTDKPIMEDGDLCLQLHKHGPSSTLASLYKGHGRIKQLPDGCFTSGRRLQAWGPLWATYVHFRIAIAWYLGAPASYLAKLYHKLYRDEHR